MGKTSYQKLVHFGQDNIAELKQLEDYESLSFAFRCAIDCEDVQPEQQLATIIIKINRPPPLHILFWKIKMSLDQEFRTIIKPLQQKSNKTLVSLSFDGERFGNH